MVLHKSEVEIDPENNAAAESSENPRLFEVIPGTIKRTTKKISKSVEIVTKNVYDVYKSQIAWMVLWVLIAIILGWRAFFMYHGDLNQDCFAGTFEPPGFYLLTDPAQLANVSYTLQNGTTLNGVQLYAYHNNNQAPSCNPYGKDYYISIGILGFMVLSFMYETYAQKAIQMPFSTATLEGSMSMTSINDDVQLEGIRKWQYIGHAVSALAFFFIWLYIDGDSDESKAFVHEAGRSHAGMFRAWMVVWPTCMAEFGTVKTHNMDREKWQKNHMGWAAMSIVLKLFLMLTLHFVLDPETQLLWMHDSDSDNQTGWVIGIAVVLIFISTYFWYSYLQRRYVEYQEGTPSEKSQAMGDPLQRLQNRMWAYVDFPTFLTMVAMISYNVTARLEHAHGNTHLPANFHAAVLYLLMVLIGILNIPVNTIEADWTNADMTPSATMQKTVDIDHPHSGMGNFAGTSAFSHANTKREERKHVALVQMKYKPKLNI